jgi:hypothetical protein
MRPNERSFAPSLAKGSKNVVPAWTSLCAVARGAVGEALA